MSLKYLIRRAAVKVNRRKDIKVEALANTPTGDVCFLLSACGKGIGQHVITAGLVRTLKHHKLDEPLRAALKL